MEKVDARPSTSISTFMVLVIAAVLFTALIQPSVALTSSGEIISGEIVAPRSQSAAEMVAPLLGAFGVLGMAFSLVLNTLYTTCIGVINLLCGGIVGGLIPAIFNFCYTSAVGIVNLFCGGCLNYVWNAFNTICGMIFGVGGSIVNFLFGIFDLLFGGWIPAIFNFCYTTIIGGIVDLIVGVVNFFCGGWIPAILNALYTTCFGVIDFIIGGLGLVIGGVLGGCGGLVIGVIAGIFNFCYTSAVGFVNLIVGVVDFFIGGWILDIFLFVWAIITGLDIFNIPLFQVLSYCSGLFFFVLSTASGLCSIGTIPCCGFCIGPLCFGLSTCGGIIVSAILEGLYVICRTCSALPVL